MTQTIETTLALVLAFIAGVATGIFLLTAWPAFLNTLTWLGAS